MKKAFAIYVVVCGIVLWALCRAAFAAEAGFVVPRVFAPTAGYQSKVMLDVQTIPVGDYEKIFYFWPVPTIDNSQELSENANRWIRGASARKTFAYLGQSSVDSRGESTSGVMYNKKKATGYIGYGQDLLYTHIAGIPAVTQGIAMIWVKLTNNNYTVSEHSIVRCGTAGATNAYLDIGISNNMAKPLIRFTSPSAGTTNEVVCNNAIPLNQWVHLAYRSDGSSWSIYTNGKIAAISVARGSNAGEWFGDCFYASETQSRNFRVGFFHNSYYLKGYWDDLRIYENRIDLGLITNVYNRTKNVVRP